MSSLSKRKLIPAIVVFLIGVAISIIGALFKILHWPYASTILIIGNGIEVLGIIIAIIILLRIYSNNQKNEERD